MKQNSFLYEAKHAELVLQARDGLLHSPCWSGLRLTIFKLNYSLYFFQWSFVLKIFCNSKWITDLKLSSKWTKLLYETEKKQNKKWCIKHLNCMKSKWFKIKIITKSYCPPPKIIKEKWIALEIILKGIQKNPIQS